LPSRTIKLLHLGLILSLCELVLGLAFSAKFYPVAILLFICLEVVVNMSESFIERFCAMFAAVHNIIAESAPEVALVVTGNSASFDLYLLKLTTIDLALLEVSSVIVFTIVEYLKAMFAFLVAMGPVASVAFRLDPMGLLLVSLPVVLAPKTLVAFINDTPIWPSMSFHVLLQLTLSRVKLKTEAASKMLSDLLIGVIPRLNTVH